MAPQTSYSYAVRVVDTAKREESESSPAVTVTTPAGDAPPPPPPGPTPPSAPKGFKHDRSNQSSITMSWQQSSPGSGPIAGYRIYRDGSMHRTVNNLSFTDTDLPANKTHEYFVRAFDTAGRESADSAHVRMSTLPWAKAGPWRFTLYDRSTADNELRDAIKFNGIGQPTKTQVGVEDYAVAYERRGHRSSTTARRQPATQTPRRNSAARRDSPESTHYRSRRAAHIAATRTRAPPSGPSRS